MSPKKHDGLAIVFGGKPKGKEEDPEVPMGDEPEGEEGYDGGGFETACEEFFKHLGVAPTDMAAACESLKNLIHLADEDEEKPSMPDMGEGEEKGEE